MEVYKGLKEVMNSLSLVYNYLFQWLLKAKKQSDEDIFEGVQAVV